MTDAPKPIQIAQVSPEQEQSRKAFSDAFFQQIREQVVSGKMTKIDNLGSVSADDMPHPAGWDKKLQRASASETETLYFSSQHPDTCLSLRDRGVALSEDPGKYFVNLLAKPQELDAHKLNADFQDLRDNQDPKSFSKTELYALQSVMEDIANPKLYELDSVKVSSLNGMNVLEVTGKTVEKPDRSFYNVFFANTNPYLRGIKVGEISFKAPTKQFMDNITDVLGSLNKLQWERQ